MLVGIETFGHWLYCFYESLPPSECHPILLLDSPSDQYNH